MQKLQRNHAMTFRVTGEERDMIQRRQEQRALEICGHICLKWRLTGGDHFGTKCSHQTLIALTPHYAININLNYKL